MTGIPCRRCGKTTADMTRLWKPSPGGALAPYAAECRGRCASSPDRRSPRAARPAKGLVGVASRPGKCPSCIRDILPGDKIVHLGTGSVHFDCAVEDVPLPDPGDEGRRRARSRGTP